jgi:hypothetical protein
LFEAGDLRYVRLGGIEILRRVYGAVRDQNWGTPPGILSDLRVERGRGSFEVRYRSTHRQDPIDFVWDATIRGEAAGSIRFEMNGVARSTFLRSRIGLCVLHPVRECSGITCKVKHAGGVAGIAVFPEQICAQLPIAGFFEMRALSYEAAPDLRVELTFEGDLFETEDQRNWTDASFKTFSTPVRLPVPVEVRRGTTVSQAVTLHFEGRLPAVQSKGVDRRVTITVGGGTIGRLPAIGLGGASHKRPLSSKELERLRALRLSHLRVDVDLSAPDWRGVLDRAASEARMLGINLEVALFHREGDDLLELVDAIPRSEAKIRTVLLFPASEKAASLMRRITPESRIGGGTNANFYSLNESPPGSRGLDFACYAIHPQTHATDNRSLVETLEVQAETVACARRRARGLSVIVSPVTLKPRFNPDAIGPEPPTPPGELPAQVDARQMSLFGAAWTLGSLKYLAEGGAASVTYYETTGWRGVMELPEGPPLPKWFRSIAGGVYPLYHVLADVAEFAGGRILPIRSSSPLRVAGLALAKPRRIRILLANFTGEPQPLGIDGVATKGWVRFLDERSGMDAMTFPETFRTRKGRQVSLRELVLPRYGVVRIDLSK